MANDAMDPLREEAAAACVGVWIHIDDVEHVLRWSREGAALRICRRDHYLAGKHLTGADWLFLPLRGTHARAVWANIVRASAAARARDVPSAAATMRSPISAIVARMAPA